MYYSYCNLTSIYDRVPGNWKSKKLPLRLLLGMSKNKKSHLGHSLRMLTSRDMLGCNLRILLKAQSVTEKKLWGGGTILWYNFMAGAWTVPKNRPIDRKGKWASSLSCRISRAGTLLSPRAYDIMFLALLMLIYQQIDQASSLARNLAVPKDWSSQLACTRPRTLSPHAYNPKDQSSKLPPALVVP